MSAIERRSDPTSLMLRALSDRECARFRNRNLRQPGRDRRVHAVEYRDWIGGLQLPVPACHQPVGALALTGDAHAVTEPLTCAKCLAQPRQRRAALVALDGGQIALDLDDEADEVGDAAPRLF